MSIPPWQNLGTKIEPKTSIDDALKQSNNYFDAHSRPLFNIRGEENKAIREIYREDNSTTLGICGPHWKPKQHHDVFQPFQGAIKNDILRIDYAGTLDNYVWLLCEVLIEEHPNSFIGSHDIKLYCILSNCHQKTQIAKCQFIYIIEDRVSGLLSTNFNLLKNINLTSIQIAKEIFKQTLEAYGDTQVTTKEEARKHFLKILGYEDEAILSQKRMNQLDSLSYLFEHRDNAEPTYWGILNTILEYYTYHYGHNEKTRLTELWFRNLHQIL